MSKDEGTTHCGRRDLLVAGIATAAGLVVMNRARAADAPIPDTDIQLEGIEALYDPGYGAMETGYRRLASGHLMIAAHHRLLRCDGKMFAWWLAKPKSAEEFKRWHPKDHVSIEGIEPEQQDPGRTGGVSRVIQYVGGNLTETIIEGRNATEYFDVERLTASGVTAVVCSRGRVANLPFWGNRVIHVCRDFDWGCEVRSRFWMGPLAPVDAVPPPEDLARLLPEIRATGLLKHTLEEYTYLSSFLPELYRQQNA